MQYRLALGDIILPDFQAGNDPAITSNANQLLAPDPRLRAVDLQ